MFSPISSHSQYPLPNISSHSLTFLSGRFYYHLRSYQYHFNISNKEESYNAYFQSLLNKHCLLLIREQFFVFCHLKVLHSQPAPSPPFLPSSLPLHLGPHPSPFPFLHSFLAPPVQSWVPPRCEWRKCAIHLAGFYYGVIHAKQMLGNLNSQSSKHICNGINAA